MKYTILTLVCLSLSSLLFGQSRIEFDSTVCHLGKYEEGGRLEFKLCFRNKGKAPVKIVNAYEQGSVGVCDYPKEATPPGTRGCISWLHPTSRGIGKGQKEVTVVFSDTTINIIMRYEIVPKKKKVI